MNHQWRVRFRYLRYRLWALTRGPVNINNHDGVVRFHCCNSVVQGTVKDRHAGELLLATKVPMYGPDNNYVYDSPMDVWMRPEWLLWDDQPSPRIERKRARAWAKRDAKNEAV